MFLTTLSNVITSIVSHLSFQLSVIERIISGLRADLHQRVSLVAHRDGAIRQLRDQASA